MGNRTEYLLATMKTPQYDTSGFAQSANQVSNALLSLAQQGQARATQNSQDKANEYAAQLLGQITPSNYYENAAKLRMIGSYATPDMQKGIEGYSADVKDRMSYEANLANSLLKKQEHDNALLEKKQTYEEKGLEALTQLGSSYNPIYTSKVEGSKLIPDANLFAKGVEMPTTMSGYKVGDTIPAVTRINPETKLEEIISPAVKINTPNEAFQANQQSLMDAYGAVQEHTKVFSNCFLLICR